MNSFLFVKKYVDNFLMDLNVQKYYIINNYLL